MSMLDRALVRAVIRELEAADDQQAATITGLLALILVIQDDVSEDAAPLLDYLALHFPPIAGSFIDERRRFLRDEQVVRSRSGEHVRLLLRDEFMRQLVRELED